jgi:hypothetical protein
LGHFNFLQALRECIEEAPLFVLAVELLFNLDCPVLSVVVADVVFVVDVVEDEEEGEEELCLSRDFSRFMFVLELLTVSLIDLNEEVDEDNRCLVSFSNECVCLCI